MNTENQILGIIPARFASTRFPGKPLVDIAGQTMIQRVYSRASQAQGLSDVVVATDHQKIFDHVIKFGGKAVMTSENHSTGTERCAEVIADPPYSHFNYVINIQGDEPLIDPQQINLLASLLIDQKGSLATLIKPFSNPEDLSNPNIIKVVIDLMSRAIWFSRTPIPYIRNPRSDNPLVNHPFYQHIGIYGYSSDALKTIAALSPTPNETAESLEQLRWIENGMTVHAAVSHHLCCSVDTPEDIHKVLSLLQKNNF